MRRPEKGQSSTSSTARGRRSRRLADLRFRELQNKSILQAITERRLDEVKRRLRETHEKIDTIAAACGYSNPNHLKNLFKRRFSMSMSAFRKAAK